MHPAATDQLAVRTMELWLGPRLPVSRGPSACSASWQRTPGRRISVEYVCGSRRLRRPTPAAAAWTAAGTARQFRRRRCGGSLPVVVAADAGADLARLQLHYAPHPLDLVVVGVQGLEVQGRAGRHFEVRPRSRRPRPAPCR